MATDVDADVDEAVVELNRISSTGGLRAARAVARCVVDRFFAGDIEAFRLRRTKHPSLRRLAEHPRLRMGKTRLWEALSVHASCSSLPPKLVARLSFSHHRTLATLRSDPLRTKLAREAADGAWTVRELTRRVQAVRAAETHGRTGRPPSPPMVRHLGRMLHALRLACRSQSCSASQVIRLAHDIETLWEPLHARFIAEEGEA